MAKCKWCGKGGLFQRVSREGLCDPCAPTVASEIERQSNVIYEAMHVHERAGSAAEKVLQCDVVIAAAKALVPYDDKGLQTCNPPPRLVLQEYQGFREQHLRA